MALDRVHRSNTSGQNVSCHDDGNMQQYYDYPYSICHSVLTLTPTNDFDKARCFGHSLCTECSTYSLVIIRDMSIFHLPQ